MLRLQVRTDDGYIYPADGSSSEARYPAPRGRRTYDAQAYPQRTPQYYDNRGYAPAAAGLLLPTAALLSAARAVHLSGLTRVFCGSALHPSAAPRKRRCCAEYLTATVCQTS